MWRCLKIGGCPKLPIELGKSNENILVDLKIPSGLIKTRLEKFTSSMNFPNGSSIDRGCFAMFDY